MSYLYMFFFLCHIPITSFLLEVLRSFDNFNCDLRQKRLPKRSITLIAARENGLDRLFKKKKKNLEIRGSQPWNIAMFFR